MININGIDYLTLEEQVLQNKEDIKELQEVPGGVSSVNEKTGDVVLDATDIKLTTTGTTLQANIIRIDENHDDNYNYISAVADDVVDNTTAINGLDTRVGTLESNPAKIWEATYGTSTFAEVKEKIDAGYFVYTKSSAYTTPVCYHSSSLIYFTRIVANQITLISLNTSDVWADIQNYYFEKESNKVTAISSSSTDTQYPSAKCVYNNLPLYATYGTTTFNDINGKYKNVPVFLKGTATIMGTSYEFYNLPLIGQGNTPYLFTFRGYAIKAPLTTSAAKVQVEITVNMGNTWMLSEVA